MFPRESSPNMNLTFWETTGGYLPNICITILDASLIDVLLKGGNTMGAVKRDGRELKTERAVGI